ncbi:hypothetical protein HY389_00545, partial [Candidatus Daviesbacteria bacterium]|nr:hypothetical protein [Candidatus Daviesbacteria bacterium]
MKYPQSKLVYLESSLLFLVLLFLPTQLGRHFWPQFSLVYSLPVDYLSPTLYFWDLLLVGLLVSFLPRKSKVNHVCLNLLLVFLLTQFLSLIYAQNIGAALVKLEQLLITGLFGVYLASQKLNWLKPRLKTPLLIGLFFEIFLAITQFLKGGSLWFWILGERTFNLSTPAIAKFNFLGLDSLRPYGTFSHPNILAAFLVIISPLLFFLLKNRSWQVILLALGGLSLILTSSRTAILVGIIDFGYLFQDR